MSPGPPVPFAMFGHGNIFGELVELVHAIGGRLTRVVQNLPETRRRPDHPGLQERVRRFQDPEWNPTGINGSKAIRVVPLSDFGPLPGERYLMGFTGAKQAPLVAVLVERYHLAFATLVHPAATVSPTARLGQGCIVHLGAIVGSCAQIGDHAYVNKTAFVGHDAVVGPYAMLAPGSKIAGQVRLGRGVFLGLGAIVLEDRQIGEGAVVAAGAVVTRDVPPGVMVAGVPARIRKSCAGNGDGV